MRSAGFGALIFVSSACAVSGSGGGPSDDVLGDRGAPPAQDPSSLAACATAQIKASRMPVYMLIVLDGSGSMVSDNKWYAATGALTSFFADAATRADPGIAVGLTIFSDADDPTLGWGPYTSVDVPIGFVDAAHADALSARIRHTDPAYETPMAAALTGQYPHVEGFAPSAPLPAGGKRVLVLMTDGVPYPNAQEQRPQILAAAQAESAKSVATFVVGIGSASPYDPDVYDPRFLAQVALNGSAANAGCDPDELVDERKMCHVQISPLDKTSDELEADFYAAIDGVRSAVASCELTLERTGDLDPSHVNVVYVDPSGAQSLVLEDPTDGWTWDDAQRPEKIELHGRACRMLKAQPDGVVRIVVGCRTALK